MQWYRFFCNTIKVLILYNNLSKIQIITYMNQEVMWRSRFPKRPNTWTPLYMNSHTRVCILEKGCSPVHSKLPDEIRRNGHRKGKTRGWIVRERGLEEVNANRNIEGRGWRLTGWHPFPKTIHPHACVRFIRGCQPSACQPKQPDDIRQNGHRKGKTRGWIVRERGLEDVNANRNIEGRGWQGDGVTPIS